MGEDTEEILGIESDSLCRNYAESVTSGRCKRSDRRTVDEPKQNRGAPSKADEV